MKNKIITQAIEWGFDFEQFNTKTTLQEVEQTLKNFLNINPESIEAEYSETINKESQEIIQLLSEIKMMLTKGNQFQKEIFTLKDLIAYTGYSDSTIHKLSAKKLIPHNKPTNGALFFDRVEIVEWFRKHKVCSDEGDFINK